MATFGQMLARYQGAQRLAQQQSKAQLGIAGEEEKQDILKARSDYQTAVEKEEARLREDARKRSIRKLAAKAITIGTSFIPGVGKIANAAIGAGLDYAASESVGNYKGFIKGTLGDGLFNRGAREDYDADLASTNRFFQEAYDSQKTANFVSALTAGIGQYGQYDTIKNFGQEIKTLAGNRFADASDKTILEEMDYSSLINPDELIENYQIKE
jgi:hypothetical protein